MFKKTTKSECVKRSDHIVGDYEGMFVERG